MIIENIFGFSKFVSCIYKILNQKYGFSSTITIHGIVEAIF